MSFGDIMCSLMFSFCFFLWHPFPFQRGRKVFNGAITCNFSFFYFSSTRAISPKDVNVKAEHAPSSAKRKEKMGRSSKDVPKGMQSTTKLQKAVPKGAQCKFSAQKPFQRECRAKYRRNIRRSAKSQREYHRNRRRRSSKDVPKGCRTYTKK